MVGGELSKRITAYKGSWVEAYHHVVRAHMTRTPSGTFHSHNFSAVMSCLLRDTAKQLVVYFVYSC